MSHRLTSRLVSRLSSHIRAPTPTPPAAITCAARHLMRYVKLRVLGVRLRCGTCNDPILAPLQLSFRMVLQLTPKFLSAKSM